MWQWFAQRRKRNTLNMGDGDDGLLSEDIEKVFRITIEDNEAERVETMGDLEALIAKKRSLGSAQDIAWELMCRIARDVTGHRGMVDRDTTFFANTARRNKTDG